MKIYTKTGDKGTTGLVDGSRIRKSSLRIEVLGTFDEANAHLGLLITFLSSDHTSLDLLLKAQSMLFSCGARIAEPSNQSHLKLTLPTADFIGEFEKSIDVMTQDLPPLTQFILPGGGVLSAQVHIARAVIRRCERLLVALEDEGSIVEPEVLQWVNRLSDWLFTLARFYNQEKNIVERVWEQG
ncbi:MAG TPA: cob(I)yrinic acid a,c-diamide adenosyltransferase [Patescibacteria group bacterium]